MKKVISLIACFSIAVFAQQEQYPDPQQQAYPPPQYQQQQAYPPPQQAYPPPQQAYPPQYYQQQAYPQPQAYPPQYQQQMYPQQQEQVKNFTTGQRWGTWGLNMLIPGLGSYVIMRDVIGGVIQDVLWIGGVIMILNGFERDETLYERKGEVDYNETAFYYIGIGASISGFIFNIVRSATYDKPGSVAYHSKDGFNVTVLPNRHGKLMPYFLYSKAF